MAGTNQNPGLLDKGIDGTIKRLEYLRGKQPKVQFILRVLAIGGAGLWFVRHIDSVNSFFDSLISLQEKVIYGGILAVGIWLGWRIVSSKLLRDTVTLMLDRAILKIHKWIIARDRFGAAEFSTRRLEKRKKESDEARAMVYAAAQSVNKQVEQAREAAGTALQNAKGFDQELKRRAEGGGSKVKMSEEGLQRALASAKSTLRINAEFLKRQVEKQQMLTRRCNILQEVSAAIGDKLEEMKLQLTRARQDWELALQTMNAMQASDDVVEGQDAKIYYEALDGITKEAEFFNGRVVMLMDRLDPTVQGFRTKQASDQLADEQFYEKFLNETKVTPKNVGLLPESSNEPLSIIEDAESLLGVNAQPVEKKTTTTKARTSNKSGDSSFNDLLRRK